jgi:hypothetical protein
VWFWFEGIIDLFFYVDVVLNFMTAYEVGHFSLGCSPPMCGPCLVGWGLAVRPVPY